MENLKPVLKSYLRDFEPFKEPTSVTSINRAKLLEFANRYQTVINTHSFPVENMEAYSLLDMWSICNACYVNICNKLSELK